MENSGAARICSRGRPKFFEQNSPGAVVKPSESSRNRDIEDSSPRRRGVCAVFKQNVKKFVAIAHKKILHLRNWTLRIY